MNDRIPTADDFLDEMDRTRRADRRRRLGYSAVFWLLAVYLACIAAYYFGFVPIRIGIAVLIIGILITTIREILASRKYRMPDEFYE
ncbi:MAG: hypothetical protein IJ237_11015 [Oscillospiraceae bacterium]|nr:hypothetical protein [Oscillospiraceae bacterium]